MRWDKLGEVLTEDKIFRVRRTSPSRIETATPLRRSRELPRILHLNEEEGEGEVEGVIVNDIEHREGGRLLDRRGND